MANWWKRLVRPEHSRVATQDLDAETQKQVQNFREGRIELERLLAEMQEKRQGDGA